PSAAHRGAALDLGPPPATSAIVPRGAGRCQDDRGPGPAQPGSVHAEVEDPHAKGRLLLPQVHVDLAHEGVLARRQRASGPDPEEPIRLALDAQVNRSVARERQFSFRGPTFDVPVVLLDARLQPEQDDLAAGVRREEDGLLLADAV